MRQRTGAIVAILGMWLLELLAISNAAPQLSLGTVNIAQGAEGTLSLSLSGGTEAYAGVNATFDLPAGVSFVSVAAGTNTPIGFSVDSNKSQVNGKERVAVIAYSGTGTFTAQSGVLLNIAIQASANAPLGSQTVTLGTSGLSNQDGSVSVTHTHPDGTITINGCSDTTPPSLVITSHTSNQHVSTSPITLSVTASDSGKGDSGIQGVTVNGSPANGGTATGSGTASWSKSVTLNAGSNTITVIAYDNSCNNNQNTQGINIYYDVPSPDVTEPSLVITSHIDGQHVTSSNITLGGTASDSGKGDNGIQQVTVNGSSANNGTATGSGTANWSKSLTLSGGSNTITVIAYDNSPNYNTTTKTLTIYYDVTENTIIYVSKDGTCNGHIPCWPNVQNGIASASAPSIIRITGETYNGNIVLDFDQVIALEGGWDTTFTSDSIPTTIQGSLTIKHGTMIFEYIILK